jgi:uncharacterized protein
MWSYFIAGITMGVLGSLHCVGMCGPLALSLPMHSQSTWARFWGSWQYNIGRVLCYSLLGAAAGALGQGFALAGMQQALSITFGVLIWLYLLAAFITPQFFNKLSLQQNWLLPLRTFIGRLFFKQKPGTLLAIGFLNGLLPCGMVYLALAAATATGLWTGSIVLMGAFGLGTLPLMWAIAFWGHILGTSIRARIRGAYPYMMALVACMLILRGMGLGIPFVSPAKNLQKKEIHCCVKQ